MSQEPARTLFVCDFDWSLIEVRWQRWPSRALVEEQE